MPPLGPGARPPAPEGRPARQTGALPPRLELAVKVTVWLLASLALLWRLDATYLWQDEAATAVLAQRLFTHGRPLAYDGRNLITMDYGPREDAGSWDVARSLRYFVDRGDFPADFRWTGQPWGQFLVAGLSLKLLGPTTAAARLPFALAGVVTVLLLYRLAQPRLGRTVAALASLLLVANCFWVLHTRQCRYYALTSLAVVCLGLAWLRWVEGRPHGPAGFVAVSLAFFHCDYGLFWPMVGLALLAAAAHRPLRRQAAAVGLVLAALLAPFVAFYRLLGRVKPPGEPWSGRFWGNLFNLNQYVVPVVVLVLAGVLLWRARPLSPGERLVAVGALSCAALLLWVPLVAPAHFHRYVVGATPMGALVTAWVAGRLALPLRRSRPWAACAAAAGLAAFTGITPWVSNATTWLVPRGFIALPRLAAAVRPELVLLVDELRQDRPDPNRDVIAALQPLLRPGDEVLVNYEDIPFMFYTEAAVRGGLPLFRVLDPARPPRFAVIRRIPLVPLAPFAQEIERYQWIRLGISAPGDQFGNIPEPGLVNGWWGGRFPEVTVLERIPDPP